MAIDNLNYYSSWLPAWQQTDKYSNLPWCLKSKNLDIFSSSKSVKATAFSSPSTADADVIAEWWGLVLKTDWKVYERNNWTDTLFIDPATNFPVQKVSYTWENWPFADATRWTVQDMVVATEWDEWKSFVVFTDRASFTYSKVKFVPTKRFEYDSWWTLNDSVWTDWYQFNKNDTTSSTLDIDIIIDSPFADIPIKVKEYTWSGGNTTIALYQAKLYYSGYYYDAELEAMTPTAMVDHQSSLTFDTYDLSQWASAVIPAAPTYNWRRILRLTFAFNKVSQSGNYEWDGDLYIDINGWPYENHRMSWDNSAGDYNYYYNYLPIKERKLQEIWVYWYSMAYWLKGQSFQSLYKWISSWVTVNWQKKIIYDFVQDMWWANDPWMDVIWMIIWNEQVYMIGNLNWDWYIIPCDLTGGIGTPYVAYWCEFLWATNIDYLLYLVWKDRGISCLWAYNWQELVQVIGGNKESNVSDMIDNDEQYKFDWGIVNWRKNLILSTSDNRLFQYWQTYGGKWWAFIHELPSNAANVTLKANGKDLEISYTITASWTTTKYITKYQDDVAVKNYNTEWMAVYPMVIGNHLLEKEESDLYVSYIIPSNLTKLEFWAGANHYHFWTFKMTPWTEAPAVWSTWEIEWIGNPRDLPHLLINLEQVSFVEANGDYFTFRWVWELPVLSGNETWRLKRGDVKYGYQYLNFTEVHHFRKIWEITAGGFTEWEFRFTNLNNKLELPKSHTLQIMVKWIGTNQFTPELFSLDLVANQRDRW